MPCLARARLAQGKVLGTARWLDADPDGFAGGMNKTSRATAYRELADLVEKDCLRPTGQGGRSSGYKLLWL